jgi:ferredoxin
MHCPICDREDNSISFNKATGTFGDCSTCQAVIDETLGEFEEPEDENEC